MRPFRMIAFLLIALLITLSLHSETTGQTASGDEELEELLAILDEETEIATKTRMNSDFVPGIVTVLNGDELEALGVRNAWEAMSYIPGVQAVLDENGSPSVIVRGIPFPFNTGNVHILVNDVPLSREAAGINGTVLFIPIEQIERIEFIRGPGSVLYGDFAFQGLVNITTRRSGFRADVSGDSEDSISADLSWATPKDGPLELSGSVAGYSSDNPASPFAREAEADRTSAFLTMKHGGFSLVAQSIDHELSSDPLVRPPVQSAETSWAVEARYSRDLSDVMRIHSHLQYLDNELGTFGAQFEGDQWEVAMDLGWDGWARQQWLVGLQYSDARIDFAAQRGLPPPGGGPPPLVPIGVGETRDVFSVVFQDQIKASDALAFTIGARYDDNSDIGSRVTPRLSAVWRIAESHILKAQYAEGYRAPTFFELYRNPNQGPLDFEVNETAEINYVFRRPQTTLRATLFRLRLRDMIFVTGPVGFDNRAEATADGVELEWSQRLGASLRAEANASWVDSEDSRNRDFVLTDQQIAAPWMTNLAILYSPGFDFVASARWNHVADRDTSEGDDAYDIVDLTLTKQNVFVDGLDLRVGVGNALDEEIVYYSPLPVGNRPQEYGTRTYWARITWRR